MKTFCSYYNQAICKSCDLITSDYPDQILHKEEVLKESLEGVNYPALLPTVTSSPLKFRNKAKLSVTGTIENPVIGLVGEKELDQGRELLECGLHVPVINSLLPDLKQFITRAKLSPYQIAARKGELKGIIIFYSDETKESYLRFVLRSKESIDRIRKNLSFLTDKYPVLKCVSVNIQPVAHAVLEGEEEVFLTEKTSITHRLGNVELSLGPRAFVQTNQSVAGKLYSTAATWVKSSGQKRFLELFCGQGAFSFFCAPFIEQGLGIEINPDAVQAANKTAGRHKLHQLHFKAADASEVAEEIRCFKPDIILVNPPRRGLAQAVQLLNKQRPDTIIYSSCNHETLVSDVKLLNGYQITRIQIFDMFPHTSHFETLVELKATSSN